jgi:hypothetical protein
MKNQTAVILATVSLLVSCASTSTAVSIGNGAYMMSAKGAASPFGLYSDADTIGLIQQATTYCDTKGADFELVNKDVTPTRPGRRGTATITFKCPPRK